MPGEEETDARRPAADRERPTHDDTGRRDEAIARILAEHAGVLRRLADS